ncbi:hypothetical protein [Haloarcula sp. CBA1127]|uniref:hypothetical protein n=1 Tax=Haloarcula sp. CBA1127 TaxID=1765055 RepID=UPI00073F4294|nr:hypothetical protein [Haloarcula sp. CBA1127]
MSAVGLTDVYRYGTRFLGTLLVVAGVGGGLIAAGYVLIQNGSLGSLSGNAGYRAVLGIVVGALGGLLLLSGVLGLTHKLIADATMAGTLAAQTARRDTSDMAAASPPTSDQAATETVDGSAAAATEPTSESDEPTPGPAGPEPAVSQDTEPAADPAADPAAEPATGESEVSEPVADSEPNTDSAGDSGIHAPAQQHPDPSDAAAPSASSDTATAGTDDAPVTAADDDPLADADPATDAGPVTDDGPATDEDALGIDDTREPPLADDAMDPVTDEDAVETAPAEQDEQILNQQPAENVAGPEPEAVDDTTAEPSPSDFAGDSETVEPQSEPSAQSDRDLLAEDAAEEPEPSTEPQEWTPPDPAEFDTRSEEPAAADDWGADEPAPADDWETESDADTEPTGAGTPDTDEADQHDAVTQDTRLLDESGEKDTSGGPRTTDDLFGGGTGDEQSGSGVDESVQGEAEPQDADATDDEDATLADDGVTGFDVSSDDDPLSDPLDDE